MRKRTRPVKPNSRTVPERGRKPDVDESQLGEGIYRCWFCKQICDENRDYLGGPDETNSINLIDNQVAPDLGDNDPLTRITVLSWPSVLTVIGMELGEDGNELVIVHDLYPVTKTGCPLCGTANWRGDY